MDEDFQEMAEAIRLPSEETERSVESLIDAVEKITTELTVEGHVAENFKTLKQEIESLKGQFSDIYDEVSQAVEEFINEVDTADDFLY